MDVNSFLGIAHIQHIQILVKSFGDAKARADPCVAFKEDQVKKRREKLRINEIWVRKRMFDPFNERPQ